MKLNKYGKSSSKAEVLGITPKGFWLLINDSEYFLNHKDFPWFKKAAVQDIFNLKLLHAHHLYWPKLDIDLDLESIKNPKHYPLTAKHS